jgi:chlorite dismutase
MTDHFTLFAVFGTLPSRAQAQASGGTDFPEAVSAMADQGVTLRGIYDVTGMRAEASLMVWLHGPDAADLQSALRALRRTAVLQSVTCEWSAMGVHRDAEFNKSHIPGFVRGVEPQGWLCLYPFVRSFEWYLLPDQERSALLIEHGRKGAAYTDVVTNTVATFALSDYEWLLPLESDNLLSLVDMMRDLRATGARRHVREEVPFYTGRRIQPAEIEELLI